MRLEYTIIISVSYSKSDSSPKNVVKTTYRHDDRKPGEV